MTDLQARVEALEHQVNELLIAQKRATTLNVQERQAALAADIDAIVAAVSGHEPDPGLPGGPYPLGTMPQYLAHHLYGRPAVNAAVDARRLHRIRPKGYATTMLTTELPPPRDDATSLLPYLRADDPATGQPRLAATFAQLRTALDKNTLNRSVRALHDQGEIRLGILKTDRPGRPPRVVGLAGEPLPTHVDGLPVKWES